jgi:hypothetical protein
MRSRAVPVAYLVVALVAALVAVLLTRALLPTRAGAAPPPVPAPASAGPPSVATLQTIVQPAPPPPAIGVPPDPATVKGPGYLTFLGWALLDRPTGKLTGSANRETASNTTESMIKVWIAADYLRHQGSAGTAAQDELYRMIINSDDAIAHKYFELNGGDASITELVQVCGLQNTKRPSLPDQWSYTTMSPADAVRLGQCVTTGKAAGPTGTPWLLKAMRNVKGGVADQQAHTGGGRWGIIDGLPASIAADVSIKNGWTAQVYDHNWHINCLAIHPDWVLAIELRYPWTSPDGNWQHANNLQQGADACRQVTRQLLVTPDF